MKLFGLIGFPLTHSFSKKYFTEKFKREGIADSAYELYPLEEITLLEALLADQPHLAGLNVTIPYKLAVLDYVDELDAAAAYIGAVNTLKITYSNGKRFIKGYNTDAYGFESSLKPLLEPHHQQALIFGDGGAAKAVKYVLEQLNITYTSVVRRPQEGCLTYDDLDEALFAKATILINTTPLGTYPDVAACPNIPYELITSAHLAYDLVYNPEETAFLRRAAANGAKTKNGLDMLHLQAERAWAIWTA
jgi:shikimate dehydrogenase